MMAAPDTMARRLHGQLPPDEFFCRSDPDDADFS
jgi:hypothetical protein